MEAGARGRFPPAAPWTPLLLSLVAGEGCTVGGHRARPSVGLRLRGDREVPIENGGRPAELLLLQARPIGRPVAQHGPFVMNTRDEILRAFEDYQRPQFGGWPWPDTAPVHRREPARFARYPDGREEHPGS